MSLEEAPVVAEISETAPEGKMNVVYDVRQFAKDLTMPANCRTFEKEELLGAECSEHVARQEVDCIERTSVVVYLPESLLLEIFSYLKFSDRCRCAQVCKRWSRIVKDRSLLGVIDVSNLSLTFRQFTGLVNSHCTPDVVDFRMKSLKCALSNQSQMYSRAVFELVKKCPSLQKLTLKYYVDSDPEYVTWMGHIVSHSQALYIWSLPNTLVHLSLRGSLIFPYSFFGRAPHEHLPLLKCLDVGEVTNLTSKDIAALSSFKNLQSLYLDSCIRINYGGIEHIMDILPQLFVLDLEGTDINNLGVCYILENCINLKELFIGQTDVTSEAFFSLRGNTASHLTKLCIKNTPISSHAIHYFVTQSFAGKNVLLITSWDEIAPKCLIRHRNCCIVNYTPEIVFNEPCCHFQDHVCTKFS